MIEPLLAADHGPTTSLYYEDPDGNSVELLVDNFGNWDESSEFMRTSPEFAAKPMGTYVDPDKLVAAFRDVGTLRSGWCRLCELSHGMLKLTLKDTSSETERCSHDCYSH